MGRPFLEVELPSEGSHGKEAKRKVYPRQRWADRIKKDLIKCTQKITIEDSIDRYRWKNVVEIAKVLQP